MFKSVIAATALLALSATSAFAHVSLATKEAPVGSTYKAIFQVPHGCAGAPTNTVRVQIPEGVIAVKPQPKAGWTLTTVKGAYEKSHDYYGVMTSEGVKEVVWSGGDLSDEFYDEFLLRGYLTADLPADTTLYFPVIQECGTASEAWIETPAAGQTEDDLELPAPGVALTEADHPGH